MKHSLLIGLVLFPLIALSEQQSTQSLPEGMEVVRYEQGDNTIEEYRMRGILYSVKVIPKHGEPYSLVNADGNNSLFNDKKPQAKIPSWTLFSW